MNNEVKEQILQQIMRGGLIIGNLIIENSGSVTYNSYDNTDHHKLKQEGNREAIGRAIREVQCYMWGKAAYAVIFCAMRDGFKYGDNATQFETTVDELSHELGLDYPCPPNTIASSFYNNSYLKLNVERWEAMNVKPRSVFLAKAFHEAMVKELEKF